MLYSRLLHGFRHKIGLPTVKGNCALHVEKSINSFLESGDIAAIKKRIAYVLSQAGRFYPSFFLAQPKIKEEERELKHYLITGDLYQSPELHKSMFGRVINQNHAHEISHFVQSPQLEQLGGRVLLKTIVGIQAKEDFKKYVNFLFDIAKNAPHDFAISINNSDHIISLCYSKKDHCWHLINILSEPITVESLESSRESLAQKIWDSLLEWAVGPQVYPFIGTMTRFYTTGGFESEMTEWVNLWQTAEPYHALIKDGVDQIEQRRTVKNLDIAQLAAMADDVDTLTALYALKPSTLLQPKADFASSIINLAIHNSSIHSLNYLFTLEENLINQLFLPNHEGMTIFHILAYYGRNDMLEFLLKMIDLTEKNPFYQRDNDGQTPLFLASQNGHADTVKLITAYDLLSINQQDTQGNTPLLIAAQNAHTKVLDVLIQLRDANNRIICDLNHVNKEGESVAYICVQEGSIEALQYLLSLKDTDNETIIDLNKSDNDGRRPILLAVSNGDVEMTLLLLNYTDLHGNSIIDLKQPIPVLGGNLLHLAALKNHVEIAEILLSGMDKNGIDIFMKDNNGETAKEIALAHQHNELAIKLSATEIALREQTQLSL